MFRCANLPVLPRATAITPNRLNVFGMSFPMMLKMPVTTSWGKDADASLRSPGQDRMSFILAFQ